MKKTYIPPFIEYFVWLQSSLKAKCKIFTLSINVLDSAGPNVTICMVTISAGALRLEKSLSSSWHWYGCANDCYSCIHSVTHYGYKFGQSGCSICLSRCKDWLWWRTHNVFDKKSMFNGMQCSSAAAVKITVINNLRLQHGSENEIGLVRLHNTVEHCKIDWSTHITSHNCIGSISESQHLNLSSACRDSCQYKILLSPAMRDNKIKQNLYQSVTEYYLNGGMVPESSPRIELPNQDSF